MAEPLPRGCHSLGLSTKAVRTSTFGLAPPLLLTTTAHSAYYSLLVMFFNGAFFSRRWFKVIVHQKIVVHMPTNPHAVIFDNIYFKIINFVCVCFYLEQQESEQMMTFNRQALNICTQKMTVIKYIFFYFD